MPKSKYAKYFATEVVAENKWGGEGISLSKFPKGVIPPDSKMSLGVSVVRKPYMFHEPVHKHNFTEYFFFFASGFCMNDFQADVEFSFGEKAEKQTINSPSIIVVPPMVYHCPLNYARIDKPIYCLEAFLTSEYSDVKLADEKDTKLIKIPELNYKRFVVNNVVGGNRWGGEGIGLGKVNENLMPAQAKMNLGITLVRKSYMFHEPVHKHDFTEYFFFFGANPDNMKEFDARVEFTFGAEKEKQIITKPTVVVIPPGVYHCPLNFAQINKPIYCLEAFMTSSYSGTNLEDELKAEKGKKEKKAKK